MKVGEDGWRRALGRALTREEHASVRDILASPPVVTGNAWRIGITGPPGAGKSSVIACLAQQRLERMRSVAILAIDPTSALSGGSLLGDRVRMDAIADDQLAYIRSVPSGLCHNGLCRNVLGMLDVLDRAAFDDIVLETVGVGQANYEARLLVDSFVLVLIPGSGDVIQAMKAGIMELADIYVINKADLPGADKMAAELRALIKWRESTDGWQPPIVRTSALDGRGFEQLDEVIEAHATHQRAHPSPAIQRERHRFQVRALVDQRIDELLAEREDDGSLAESYARIADGMRRG